MQGLLSGFPIRFFPLRQRQRKTGGTSPHQG